MAGNAGSLQDLRTALDDRQQGMKLSQAHELPVGFPDPFKNAAYLTP